MIDFLYIVKPGQWIDTDDRDWAHEIEWLLILLESKFGDAMVALRMYIEETEKRAARHADFDPERLRERFFVHQNELTDEITRLHGDVDIRDSGRWQAARVDAEISLARKNWLSGEWPQSMLSRRIVLHALSFLYAVDGFIKLLRVIAGIRDVPAAVSNEVERLMTALPAVKAIRDSTLHIEDRARGLDRRGRRIALKPFSAGGIVSTNGTLVLGSLHENRFGCTSDSGDFVQTDISIATLREVQTTLSRVYEAFEWRGGPELVPTLSWWD